MSNGILPLTATVTGIAFDCIDDAIFHSFYNTGNEPAHISIGAFLDLNIICHTAKKCLTGQAAFADFLRECFQLVFGEIDNHSAISFSHEINLSELYLIGF